MKPKIQHISPNTKSSHSLLTRSGSRSSVVAASITLALLAAPALHALTYYWDGNDGMAGFGTASGTWADPTAGTATEGWSTDTTGGTAISGNSIATATTDTINFGNGSTGLGAGTINISATVGSGSMTFASGSGAIVLAGSAISMAATSTITVNNATDTISSIVAGAGTSLTKAGIGTLVLSGANPFIGNFAVTAGTVNIQSNTALGSLTGTTAVSNNAALEFQGGVTVGAETLTNIQGSGVGTNGALRNISGTNSFAGAITFGNSTRFASDAGTLTLSGNITGGTRGLILSGAGDIVYSGIFASSGAVTKDSLNGTGTGTVTFSGNNTYSGATNISAGTLKLGAAGGGTNTPLGTAAAGTLVTGTGSLDLNGFTLGTAEALSLNGTGALKNTSATAASYSGLVTLTGAASIVSTGNILLTNSSTIGGAFGLTLDGTATGSSIASVIGTGSLTKTGSGRWTLTRSNSYTGATSITGGTLAITGTGLINTSSGITINGSDAKFLYNSSLPGTNAITLTEGTIDGTGSVGAVTVVDLPANKITNGNLASSTPLTLGSLTLSGDATFDVRTDGTLAGVVVTGALTTTPANGTGIVNVTSGPSWVNGTTYNLISYGSFAGAIGDFTKGTIVGLGARQSAALVDTGTSIALTISGDTLRWTGAASTNWTTNAVGSPFNWITQPGGTSTDFIATDSVIFNDAAAGSGAVSVNISTANVSPATMTFSNAARNYTISSGGGFGISTGSLTKSGAATLNLATANTYTGTTAISDGTLNLTGSLNGTAITVSGTGLLTESSGGVLSGLTSLTHTSSGASTLAGANTYTGATAISAGTVNLTGSLAGTAVTVSGTGVLSESSTGVLGGLTSLTHTSSAASTLAGANTYTGATAISAGTVNLTGSLAGTAVTVSGTGVLSQSSTGGISGAVGLTHSSSGTSTLGGTNTYTGNTAVGGGTLNITGTLTGNTTTSTLALGGTAANTVANVSNNITLFTVSGGTVTGSNSVYNQTAGTVNLSPVAGGTQAFQSTLGYGLTNIMGGTVNTSSILFSNNAAANGVAYVGGTGTINIANTGANGGVSFRGNGVLTVGPGGAVNNATGTSVFYLTAFANSTGTINVAGGEVNLGAGTLAMGISSAAGVKGYVNLASGTLTMGSAFTNSGGTGANLYANFAGGTLKASANLNSPFSTGGGVTTISTIFGAIDNVGPTQDFTGGLTVDTNGNNVTYGNALLGATGNGVKLGNIGITGGSGYIGAPFVTFAGGTLATNGTPASGYAVISGGAVTGIVITSPGEYTVDPTVTLTGGGGSGASVAISALSANAGDSGLTKIGAGTLTLSGTNTYSGNTTVTLGILALGVVNSSNDASTVTIAASGATLKLDYAGTDTVDKLFIGGTQQAAGVYGAAGSVLPIIGISQISGTGTLTVTSGPSGAGYSAWQSTNGNTQALNLDHDSDGVSNGVEYFLFGTANSTGFTALPGVDKAMDGTLSVTWTKAASYTGTYGTHFFVETSSTLIGTWTTETLGVNVTVTGNNVKYTFPAGTVNFARLKVTGP